MEEIKFSHEFNEQAYEKAFTKFTKMLETETGKKFFTHLAKSFLISGSVKTVEKVDSQSGIILCDLTRLKLVSDEVIDKFIATYKLKMSSFERLEGESDVQFEARTFAYTKALKSTNPYAANCNHAFTAEKTDKVLSIEAMSALANKFKEISEDPNYKDVVKVITFQKNKQKGKKKSHGEEKYVKPIYSTASKSTSLGDIIDFSGLKAKFSK